MYAVRKQITLGVIALLAMFTTLYQAEGMNKKQNRQSKNEIWKVQQQQRDLKLKREQKQTREAMTFLQQVGSVFTPSFTMKNNLVSSLLLLMLFTTVLSQEVQKPKNFDECCEQHFYSWKPGLREFMSEKFRNDMRTFCMSRCPEPYEQETAPRMPEQVKLWRICCFHRALGFLPGSYPCEPSIKISQPLNSSTPPLYKQRKKLNRVLP
jgi:hypothetical protein